MEPPTSQEPPVKKRRFFKDPDEPSSDATAFTPNDSSPLPHRRFCKDEDDVKTEADGPGLQATSPPHDVPGQPPAAPPQLQQESSSLAFDQDTFEAFVGDKVGADILDIIRDKCGDNLERAVNMYFDGTWKKCRTPKPSNGTTALFRPRNSPATPTDNTKTPEPPPIQSRLSQSMPNSRYIGAFGVEGEVNA